MTKEQIFQKIWDDAVQAGKASAEAKVPTPMIVGTPTTVFGSDIDVTKRVYYVPQGVCGFASIEFKGNTAFGRWAKKVGYATPNSYKGGLYVWVGDYGQSYELKCAYAGAFARVLRENGIEAYVDSRLD